MQIFIKGIDGKTTTVEAEGSDTIWALKLMYCLKEVENINKPKPHLLDMRWAGKELSDDKTLASYNIQKESTIYIVLVFRGD